MKLGKKAPYPIGDNQFMEPSIPTIGEKFALKYLEKVIYALLIRIERDNKRYVEALMLRESSHFLYC